MVVFCRYQQTFCIYDSKKLNRTVETTSSSSKPKANEKGTSSANTKLSKRNALMYKNLLTSFVTMLIVPLVCKVKLKCLINCKYQNQIEQTILQIIHSKNKMVENLSFHFRPVLKALDKENEVTLRFPDVEPLSPPILQLNEVGFRYGTNPTDPYLFLNVNLTATLQSRICIVGENGTGKTTLLKLIVGSMSPSKGTIHCHRNLKFGYFSQHHVDQLAMNVCSVELLQNKFPGTIFKINISY